MWTRAELKQRGKYAFKKKYWTSVLVSLILMIATGGSGVFSYGNSASHSGGNGSNTDTITNFFSDPTNIHILAIVAGMMAFGTLVGIAISICLWHPLEVGGQRFFMENREGESQFDAMLYTFKSGNYGNVVLTMFLRYLFTALWSLLLVIPGVVKAYEYRMIPFILSENPGMNHKDAFSISKNMMMGQKWNTFVLDLSFILWMFLALFTCGLAGIFYVNPYIYATNAELYAVLRAHAFEVGGVTVNELPGYTMFY